MIDDKKLELSTKSAVLELELAKSQQRVEELELALKRVLHRSYKMVRMDNGWVQDVLEHLVGGDQ
jgi:chromosomal replication initiation ATPase DnaA